MISPPLFHQNHLCLIPLPSYVNAAYFSLSSSSKIALIIAVSLATLWSHKDISRPGRYKGNCNDLTLYFIKPLTEDCWDMNGGGALVALLQIVIKLI